ncbi:MAG: molecular chaperone DnaJ [Alphaproteobacteria bacterium]|nr:molecular chaperone DnaJ [Alphaproteobacteria bacterium]
MAKKDYYDLLGAQRGASAEELKKCYRKQAMQYHPDRNPGNHEAEHRFKEINEAYEILSDEQRRAAYDRFGHAAFEQGGGAGGFGGFEFGAGFSDIFDEMFGEILGGGRRQQQSMQRGADLRFDLDITLEEAFTGVDKPVTIPNSIACDECKGSGAAPGSSPEDCGMCKGHGRVRAQQGFFTVERTCPTCNGAGRVIKKPCAKCAGQGRVRQQRTLSVEIPAGVEDGMRIRLAGEGEAGARGGHAGDLYVILGVQQHPLFQRDGANLYCRAPIAMTTAALGGVIEVPTIDGETAEVKVDAGTQSGHRARLRHQGMTILRGGQRGDLYVELAVETPAHLTKRQKELLTEFAAEAEQNKTHPESEGWITRIKETLGKK